MKKMYVMMLGIAMAATALAAGNPVFVLATAGDVDAELAEQVQAYLVDQAGTQVTLVAPVSMESGQSLEAIGRAAAGTLKAGEFGIIVLARVEDDQPQGVCLPHERFGILNITRLEADASRERLVRRAGQDGLRVMSMLLGMSPCPFPLCVLTAFEHTEDLDRMSGNYCPPCQDRFNRLARHEGMILLEQEKIPALDAPADPVDASPAPAAAEAAAPDDQAGVPDAE